MFYLKYRPHTIAALDNSAVKTTLATILEQKDPPHALLCVGQKGTGKTSSARIIAKSLNCFNNRFAGKGKSIEPCNTCANCLSIDTGSSPDVVEMDAASNRGIDEIRQITKEASFSPIAGKYRVYIIDEAHMITTEGFNALLKTLEEPPKTAIFILATTNEEKIPKTIRSRCMRINFGRAKSQDIVGMLQRIATAEKIALTPAIAALIVEHAENSFRDATKLLEELHMQGKIDIGMAQEYLGMRTRNNLLEIMAGEKVAESLAWVQHFFANGGSAKIILEDLLDQLHTALLVSHKLVDEPMPAPLNQQEIILLMKLFTEAYNLSKISPIEQLPLEIAIVEFYNQKK